MSASEKLKALEAVIRDGVPDDAEPALWSLKPALPQLLAVVEAAERGERYDYCDEDDGDGICSNADGRWVEWERIGAALTALEKKLS